MLEDNNLFKAVSNNAPFEEIKSMIDSGADLKETNSDGLDILAYAVMKHNDPEVIKLLVSKGLSFSQQYKNGWNLAHFAALNPNPQIMKLLMNNDVKYMTPECENLYNSLMLACIGGSPEVCKLLIRKEQYLRDRDKNGYTPTMLAILHYNVDVLKFLLIAYKKNVDISISELKKNPETAKEFAKNIISSSKDKFHNYTSLFINSCPVQKISEFFDECGFGFWKNEIFCSALEYNYNPEIIDYLMENNFFKNNYDSIFSAIVKNTSVDVWKRFLEIAITKDIRNSEGLTLLMKYVIDAPTINVDILDLLADETTINQKDNCGANVCHYAARKKNHECIKFLKNKGANINEPDNNGITPLMYVCQNDPDIELVDCLIENGAVINDRDPQGNNALFWAMGNRYFEFIKFFIRTSVNSYFGGIVTYSDRLEAAYDRIYNNYGMNGALPCYGAIEDLMKQVEAQDYDIIRNKEKKALYDITRKKYFDLMIHLINLGADIHTKNNDGENILMVALKNHVEIERINYLVSLGINVNERNNQGIPTIFYAAKYNPYLEVFKLLVDKGADLDYKTEKNENIMFFAAANRNPEIILYLCLKGYDINSRSVDGVVPLFEAARNSSLNLVKRLFNSKVVDNEGKNLMHYLCKYYSGIFWSSYPKANHFIYSFDPDCRDIYGNTPILYAAQNLSENNVKILEHIRKFEGNINAINNNGDNALMMALYVNNSFEMIGFLLVGFFEKDVNARNYKNETALMIAAKYCTNLDCIKLLLEAGADANAVDNDGNTAYELAVKNNSNPEIAKTIEKYMGMNKLNKDEAFGKIKESILDKIYEMLHPHYR